MPYPRSQLDVVWIPEDVDGAWSEAVAARVDARAREVGWWRDDGLRGGGVLLDDGFARRRWLRFDRPRFLANQQGGVRVTCPTDGRTSVVPAFMAALSAWRRGGPRALPCPACGQAHDLHDLAFAPGAGFTTVGLELVDVGGLDGLEAATAKLTEDLGPLRVVPRRIG